MALPPEALTGGSSFIETLAHRRGGILFQLFVEMPLECVCKGLLEAVVRAQTEGTVDENWTRLAAKRLRLHHERGAIATLGAGL